MQSSGWVRALVVVGLGVLSGCRETKDVARGRSAPATAVTARTSALTSIAHTGWTASASQTLSGYAASKAIDSDSGSRWTNGDYQTNQWFKVDFGAVKAFTEVEIWSNATDYPRQFNVQVSNDNSTWTTVASAAGTSSLVQVPFAQQQARYVRIQLATSGQQYWFSIYDFNVYSTQHSTAAWAATSSGVTGTDTEAKAIDASLATKWTSSTNQSPNSQWFQVDMRKRQTFSMVSLDGGATANSTYPRGYKIEASDDASTWTTLATGTGTAGGVIFASFSTTQARYLKVTQTGTASVKWSLYDFLVYGQPEVPSVLSQVGWTATASKRNSEAGGAIDSVLSTGWSNETYQAVGDWYQVDMGTSRTVSGITMDSELSNDYARGFNVYVSDDPMNWGSPAGSGTGTSPFVTATFAPKTGRYVKVQLTSVPGTSDWWGFCEFNIQTPALARAGWIVRASSTGGTDDVRNAFENNSLYRWTSAESQATEHWVTADMVTPQTFNEITLDASPSPSSAGNYPRSYEVYVSNDGTNWGTAVATGSGTGQSVAITFPIQTARYIKVRQPAVAGVTNTWSIHELEVFREAVTVCDTVTCTASDQCHDVGTCDPNTGVCSNPVRANGASCNDGNACTQTDTCQAGTCTGSNPVTCAASDQCHTAGTCDTGTGVCSNPAKADGTSCSDGNACTQTDTCVAGTCTGANAVTCTASDQCHDVGTCDTGTGVCTNPAKADGATCSDGNACTQTDTCQSGTCTGDNAVTCTASDPCHDVGTCNTTTGVCSNPAKSDGTTCSDGNACTQTDTCQAGTCTGGNSVTCTASDQCHTAGTCNTTTGVCSSPAKPDGATCSDGNACTQADTCESGVCTGGNAVTCTASDQCHSAGTCDTGTGACSNPARADGTSCNDGSLCTQADTCQAGTCGGSPVAISDGNPCTADACTAAGGVSHTLLAAGTSCSGGAACSGAEVCDAQGTCVPIDDADSCTVDVCDPGAGVAHVAVAVGTPCANSPTCAGAATCDGSGSCSVCIVGQLELFRGQVEIPHEGTLTVPAVLAGSRGVVVPLTLSNAGNGDLILSGSPNITITGPNAGDFSIQKFPPGILGAGSNGSIELKFTPSGGGTRTATLAIASNDTAHSTFVVNLTGNGLLPADLDPATNGSWAAGAVKSCNTREARVMARSGDIDNLGFGFPVAFDPFSGFNTPVHGYPWAVNPLDPAGTDRIFVGTSFTSGCRDGYCSNTSRPANLPQCVVVDLQAACFDGTLPTSGIVQMFVDDFQPRVWGSAFQVTVNGKRASQIEDGINLLAQTGPIGKLMSFTLTPEQLTLLQSGSVTVCVDDPTTHQGDGFALDFVKVLIDAYGTDYKGTISGTVAAFGTNAPIAGATVSAGGVVSTTTAANGTYTLANVPAGFVYVYASAPGFETTGQVVDLPNATTKTVNFSMRLNQAPVITTTPVTQVLVGATYAYDVNATDADGDTLTYGIPQAPLGMTFNELTGVITWAPTAAQTGTWPISVEVSDRRGGVTVQSFVINVGAANTPPTVSCQPDLHLIGSSANVTIYCSVADDGQLTGAPTPQWYFDFKGAAAPVFSPVGEDRADIQLLAPGIYEFVLTANDGQYLVTDSVVVTLSPTLTPPLSVFAGADQPAPQMVTTLVGTVLGGSGPSVEWSQVDGPALAQISTPANPTTDVTFTNYGTYHFRLTATDGFSTESDDVTVFVQPASGPPFNPTQGWIGSPIHQSTVTGLVPITVGAGVTLTAGTVTYWPMAATDQVHTLATGVAGGPGATVATLDTTGLSNGTWVIKLDATNSAGHQEASLVAVTVTGDYKPGRVVVEVNELTVPLPGIPLSVIRRYDSLEKDGVGDFGHGWSLAVGHPKVEVDPAHNVTLTMPDNRRVTFYFQASSIAASVFFAWLYGPGYVAEAGTYGTLTADGCPLMVLNGGQLVCFLENSLEYAPTTYTYTDPYGRVFTMAATGELKSIKDRQGNTLTFTADGILSNTGVGVTFERDGQGRITKVTSPDVDGTTGPAEYTYDYDGAGDLTTVHLPASSTGAGTLQYTYSTGHHLLTSKDANGNTARTSTYDTAGRLLTDTDALSNVTNYAYDLATRKTTITNPDTGTVEQTFDARGLLLKEVDPLGRTTEHTYDVNKNELTRKNALNEVTTFTYDANGNQTSIKNARNETTTITYNAFGQPLTSTNPLNQTTTVEYDAKGIPTRFSDSLGTLATFTSSENGLPLTVTDAAGNTAHMVYDSAGNMTSRTDRLSRVTQNAYDGIGRLTQVTDPRGGVTSYSYTLRGPRSRMVDPSGVAGHRARDYAYDQNGNLVSETSDEGRTTTYTFNALNHLTKVTNPDLTTVEYTRDFRGNPLTMQDEAGRTTTYQYDKAGQLLKSTFPDTKFTTRAYDDLGRLVTATDERNNATTYEYQTGCGCAERQTKVTDPLNRSTTTTYDAAGRRTSVTDAANHTTSYAYDARGHLTTTTYADNTTETDAYDTRGRRTSHTDQMSSVTQYGYDAEGQLTSVTDALTKVTSYGYDAAGNLTSVTDANNHTTTYVYDALNRKTRRTLPLSMYETFAYNMYGDQTSHVDFRGKTTTMTYDARSRLVTKTPDPTLGEPTITFTYNPTGTRLSMIDGSGTTNYTYDARDRLLTKATPAGTLTYTYDPASNVATMRSSNTNGTSVDYAWDSANQLVSVTDNRAGGVTTWAYTATGRPSTLNQPSGVGATYSYDMRDRVTSLAWKQGTNPAFGSWTYGFNNRGQRTSVTDATGRHVAYGYDAVSRLASETITNDPQGAAGNGELSYALDPTGNRLSRTSTLAALGAQSFSYDANDQLGGDGYDANGNTTAADGHTYTYDFENRLKSKDGTAVTVVYDGDGNRVAKTVGGVMTKYLADDLNPTGYLQVLEEVSGGAVQFAYTYGTMVVSQTRQPGASGQTSYYGYDAHGNVTFLTDAAGNVTDTYDYDAWGNLVRAFGTTPNSRLFVGEELDPDLGFIDLRARRYDAKSGRFSTVDLLFGDLTIPRSLNRYLYTNADPVNGVDPLGLAAADEEGGFNAGAVTRTPRQASDFKITIKSGHAYANEGKHFLDLAKQSRAELEGIIDAAAREILIEGNVAVRAPFASIVPLNGYDLWFEGFMRTAIWLEVTTYYLRF